MITFIINYDKIVRSDIAASIRRFVVLTGKKPEELGGIVKAQGGAYNPQGKEQAGIIYQYKIGKVSRTEFFQGMCQALGPNPPEPKTPGIEKNFWEAWNCMCTLTPETIEELRKVMQFCAEKGLRLHVIASSNSSQHIYIQEQLLRYKLSFEKDVFTCSFEEHTLDPDVLYKKACEKFDSSNCRDIRGEKECLLNVLRDRVAKMDRTPQSTEKEREEEKEKRIAGPK